MELTHFKDGQPQMVDISHKETTTRVATASCWLLLPAESWQALAQNKKGDPLAVAQLAGIMGAKQTSQLIPLCHPLPISKVDVKLQAQEPKGVYITAMVKTTGQTGVEMEALTACSVAALALYDMLKASSKALIISEMQLEGKSGGASGDYRREP